MVSTNRETFDGQQTRSKQAIGNERKRLRNQFVFLGAHTGRFSGRGVQPQNLLRAPTNSVALAAMLTRSTVSDMEALSSCVRPCIRAPKGKKFLIADLAAIENRVLAWLSGCEAMLQVYRDGLDPYKSFAVELFGKPYEKVTKAERQLCKPVVLGAGYGLGGGQERTLQNGQKVKTGLWNYAESMGVVLSQAEAKRMVGVFRIAYAEVVYFWDYLESAFLAAYKTKKRQQVGLIYVTADSDAVRIELPSGRSIHFLNCHAWRGPQGMHISFDGLRAGSWGRVTTYGGRLTENVVQAVARDVLTEGMIRAEQDGMPIVLHVHDELVAEIQEYVDWRIGHPMPTSDDLCRVMSAPIDWAPGLPLAAEGFESEFYEKR